VFSCFEVTIGWSGKERVDYITYDTKGIWRCYEVKVSLSDFRSKAKKTFCGHYNYYVMPSELFEKVKDEIPSHIGVYVNGNHSVKRAKKQELSVDEQVLKDSMIRSLCREFTKQYKSGDPSFVDIMNRGLSRVTKERDEYKRKYHKLMDIGYKKMGRGWHREDL